MEGDGGLLDELVDQPLQCGVVDAEVAAGYEVSETVDERIGSEERLLEQRVLAVGIPGYLAQECQELSQIHRFCPFTTILYILGIGMTLEDAYQPGTVAAVHHVEV